MKTVYDNIEVFENILTLLENQFGSNCEIVLHDNTKEYEHSIVDIRNGHITNRKTADIEDNAELQTLARIASNTHIFNKIIHMRDGKILRSSSIAIHDDDGHNIGSICINTDITDTVKCEEYLKHFNMYTSSNAYVSNSSLTDVNKLLDNLLEQCDMMFNKPRTHLNKDEKMQVIRFLDDKGAFLITKSGDKVCDFLGISKFTLYNYLENIRQDASDNYTYK